MKNVWSNCYGILHITYSKKILLFLFLIFLGIFIGCFKIKLSVQKNVEMIHRCEEICWLEGYLPLEISRTITKQTIMKINNREIQGEIELQDTLYQEQLTNSFQKMKINLSESKWYNNQSISLQITQDKKTLFSYLWDSMKGGDKYA